MLSTRTSIVPVAQAFALLSLLTASALSTEPMNHDRLHRRQANGAQKYIGCYSTAGSLDQVGVYTWQSQSYCAGKCSGSVIGLTNGNTCYCGDEIPSKGDQVDDSQCGTQCSGWPSVNCGGTGYWSFWTSGKGTPTTASGDGSTSSSTGKDGSSTTDGPSVVTSQVIGGSTVVVTVPATSTSSGDSQGSGGGGGGNTAGIAAGAVVGVVALSSIVAGVYFFLRRRKQKQAEEDYKQRTQVAEFMRGTNERKPPGSSYSGMSDQRLDPEAGRRNSAGSLADNQDYSRRILRVANPDSS